MLHTYQRLPQHIRRRGSGRIHSPVGFIPSGGIPQRDLELLLTMGPDGDPTLNLGTRWYDRAENPLLWSEDISNPAWTKTNSTADSTTLLTFDAQNGLVSQGLSTINLQRYTLSFKVRAVTGNTALHFYHNGLTPGSTSQTITATLTRYSITITGDGGTVSFGIQDQNAAGHGQIEITELQVTPGTSSGTYRKTEARQRVWDWSGNARHAQVGSAGGADTNDPSDAVWRKNLLADGSTEDLENAAWTAANVTVNSATTMTFDAQGGKVTEDITTVEGVNYTISFKARRITGNYDLAFRHTNSATGHNTVQVITDTLARYNATVLGKVGGGIVSFGITDNNAAGHGQIEVTEWQVEVGALSDYDASDRMVVAARGDFDGADNYLEAPAFMNPLTSGVTVAALVKSNSFSGYNSIISQEDGGGTGRSWLSLNSADNKVRTFLGGAELLSSTTLSIQTWHVVAAMSSASGTFLYLDGIVTASNANTPETAAGVINIGCSKTHSQYLDGTIALVAVYSRALSAEEVLSFYKTVDEWWSLDRKARKNLVLP